MGLIATSMMRISAAVFAASLWFPVAHATVVLPGQSNVPIADLSFDFDPVVQKSRTFDFGGFAGHVIDSVISVNGFLAFETQVVIDSAPSNALIDQVRRTHYTGFTTDARPEPDRGGGLFPETTDRSDLPGDAVTFNFLGNQRLGSGSATSFFVVLTNATNYREVGELRLGSGGEFFGPLTVFSPVAAIPEPGQWLFLLTAAGLLAALSRRRGNGVLGNRLYPQPNRHRAVVGQRDLHVCTEHSSSHGRVQLARPA